jgi:hypothetical protein
MQGMSERQYATHVGLSRGAIQKARKAGRLVVHADGSIDCAASDARRAVMTDPAKQRPSSTRPKLKPVPEAALSAVGDTLREQGLSAPTGGATTTFLQARTANEVLKAQERRLKLQKMKGELVALDRAKVLVFRLARQERDAWVNWPGRVAAIMAAEFGVEVATMHEALERQVRLHLGELADVRADFR